MTLRSCWLLTLALASVGLAAQPAAAQIEVVRSKGTGRVIHLRVHSGQAAAPRIAAAEPVAEARRFLSDNKALLGIQDPVTELVAGESKRDPQGMTHITFHQTYHGIPVVGGEVLVHVGRDGAVASAGNKFASGLALDPTPVLSAEQAAADAIAAWRRDFHANFDPEINGKSLVVLPVSLVSNTPDGATHLAWEIGLVSADSSVLSDELYYLDAKTGEVAGKLTRLRLADRTVRDCAAFPGYALCVLDSYSSYYDYYFGRSEAAPPRGPYPISSYPFYYGSLDVDYLHDLLGSAQNYWQDAFGRNGANNQGGLSKSPLAETVGWVHTDNTNAVNCPNNSWISWSTPGLAFCRKQAVPDVVGHEYTHGVAYWTFTDATGSPIGTTYQGETGALEESFADLGGEGFELYNTGTHDWHMGLWQNTPAGTYPSSGALARVLSAPWTIQDPFHSPIQAYPARFYSSDVFCGTYDHGGIHHNSTIPSYAMYLLSEGGDYNGCHINAIGFAAAQQILYHAWEYYFVRTDTFNEAYVAMIEACDALYSSTHPEYTAEVTKAFQAVEMDQAGACVDSTGALWHAPDCAGPVAVGDLGGPGRSDRAVKILGAAPNPFSPRTAIRWTVAKAGPVNVEIYDLGGKLVRHLRSGPCPAGTSEAAWDGANDAGQRLATGVFFVRVSGGGGTDSRKIMRLK